VHHSLNNACHQCPKWLKNTSFGGVQRVLKKFGPSGARLPETGICTHTKVAAPYMLNNSLWLVDFPGGDGLEDSADMWKQFTALSTSAILFLDFKVRLYILAYAL
jgi:hypothetical protein